MARLDLFDTFPVTFTEDVVSRSSMSLLDAMNDKSLPGSRRFYIDKIVMPSNEEFYGWSARENDNQELPMSVAMYLNEESPKLLEGSKDYALFSPAEVFDLITVTRGAGLSHIEFFYQTPTGNQRFFALKPSKNEDKRKNGDPLTLSDLSRWYSRSKPSPHAHRYITIGDLMNAYRLGRIDFSYAVKLKLTDSEFRMAYNRLSPLVPQGEALGWLLVALWDTESFRSFTSRLSQVIEVSLSVSLAEVTSFLCSNTGVYDILRVKKYVNAGISFEYAEPFLQRNVRDIKLIKKALASGIDPELFGSVIAS